MASFQEFSTLDDDEEKIAEALEVIVAMIEGGINNIKNALGSTEIWNGQESFSYLARMDDEDEPASFVARLQDAAFSHATVAHSVPEKRFGDELKGVLVDTRATRGRSVGSTPYQA